MAYSTKAPPLPPAGVALVDPKTGLPTVAFYEFLAKLSRWLEGLRASVP